MDSHPQSCQLECVEDRCGSTDAKVRVSDANGSCLSAPGSPPSTGKSTPRSATKGFGLRKWRRRIRRDDVAAKEVEATVSCKPLKRGAPTTSLGANPPTDSTSADPRHITEDSVGSVKMPICNPGAVPAVDSENCDDHLSSKSSTAASAPRSKEKKNKIKNNTSGKVIGAPVLRMPQGKGKLEGIKKARGGEGIKIETENSHSSMESDSRSSNFVFMQGACSVTSNRNQSSRVPMSSSGENGDESLAEEQTIYNQGADGESEDYLRDNDATGHPTSDCDPLLESIRNLQSVHEVLETEVHRFGQLGRGNIGSMDVNPEVNEPSSSRHFDSQINGQSTSQEPQVAGLTEKIKMLEIRLKDAHNKLKAKEEPVDGDFAELENEVEDHYKQRIAAEVAYLVLAKFVQKLKVAAEDPISLLNQQQKALTGEHVEMLDKPRKAEAKYYADILQAEEVVKMERRRVRKVTTCLLIELILLVWVVWLLVMQSYPESGIVVPT